MLNQLCVNSASESCSVSSAIYMKIDWSEFIHYTHDTGWTVRKMTYDRSPINGMRSNLPWSKGTEITWIKDKTIYTGKVAKLSYDCLYGELVIVKFYVYESAEQAQQVLDILDI